MELSHIIQARTTVTKMKHVCRHCGTDAYLRVISYEVTTPDILARLEKELRESRSLDKTLQLAHDSLASQEIYQATIAEQRQGFPQVHDERFLCFSCEAYILMHLLDNRYGGEILLADLMRAHATSAIWALREIVPDQSHALVTSFQDVESLIRLLQDDPQLSNTSPFRGE